jgi:hypothetical protein
LQRPLIALLAKWYKCFVFIAVIARRLSMQHESHIPDEAEIGTLPKLIAVLAIVAGLLAIGAYVVYGSGMWAPQPEKAAY